MKKLTQEQKMVSAGIGPMAAWVAIMGVMMIGNLIASTVTSITDKVTADGSSKTTSSSYTNSKKSMYVRMSPFPNRSAVNMWV